MKLSPEQIEQLYAFTQKFNVPYYDLQIELVDHLANAIEKRWEKQPEVSFEDALFDVYLDFGLPGFNEVVEERRKWLQAKYNKIAWGNLKEFFKLPLVILTISLLVVFTLYFDEGQKKIIEWSLLFIFLGLDIYYWVFGKIKKYSTDKMERKKWLFEEVLRERNSVKLFNYLIIINVLGKTNIINAWAEIFFEQSFDIPPFIESLYDSVIIVFVGLYIYIIKIAIPIQKNKYLKETYPEYEISK